MRLSRICAKNRIPKNPSGCFVFPSNFFFPFCNISLPNCLFSLPKFPDFLCFLLFPISSSFHFYFVPFVFPFLFFLPFPLSPSFPPSASFPPHVSSSSSCGTGGEEGERGRLGRKEGGARPKMCYLFFSPWSFSSRKKRKGGKGRNANG